MPMTTTAGDTRANIVAASLVGAVVLVLGFGSGIGAVFSRHTAFKAGAAHGAHGTQAAAVGSPGSVALPAADGSGAAILAAEPVASSRYAAPPVMSA
ncbi:MAG TPA: hypothetical protein VF954_00730, partial [Acidimicrobiales bacterium]